MHQIEVLVSLWVDPERVPAFEAYERKAARIMARHGGVIERTIRCAPPAGATGPFEVHLLRFPDAAAFDRYRADPELARLSAEREHAIVRTEVVVGTAGPAYSA